MTKTNYYEHIVKYRERSKTEIHHHTEKRWWSYMSSIIPWPIIQKQWHPEIIFLLLTFSVSFFLSVVWLILHTNLCETVCISNLCWCSLEYMYTNLYKIFNVCKILKKLNVVVHNDWSKYWKLTNSICFLTGFPISSLAASFCIPINKYSEYALEKNRVS